MTCSFFNINFHVSFVDLVMVSLTDSMTKCIFTVVMQTPAAAPFIETNLLPDVGTPPRHALSNDSLESFAAWAHTNLAPTTQYDDALLFTA